MEDVASRGVALVALWFHHHGSGIMGLCFQVSCASEMTCYQFSRDTAILAHSASCSLEKELTAYNHSLFIDHIQQFPCSNLDHRPFADDRSSSDR